MTDEKVRENRLRRVAERRGYRLEKSRRRDPLSVDYGGYQLAALSSNVVELGCSPNAFSATLDDVEAFLGGSPDPVELPDGRVMQYLSRLPKRVPAGKVLVHNTVAPTGNLNSRGFRAWLTTPDKSLEVCPCRWAPELGEHYRVRLDAYRSKSR